MFFFTQGPETTDLRFKTLVGPSLCDSIGGEVPHICWEHDGVNDHVLGGILTLDPCPCGVVSRVCQGLFCGIGHDLDAHLDLVRWIHDERNTGLGHTSDHVLDEILILDFCHCVVVARVCQELFFGAVPDLDALFSLKVAVWNANARENFSRLSVT